VRDQRLNLAGEPDTALVKRVPRRDRREQMSKPLAGDRDEPIVGRDPHDRLRHAERHDLGVGDLAPRVPRRPGQEIVGDAVNNREQQVEVGEHRGSLFESAVTESTADFDLRCYVPFPAATASSPVALLI
jgi:hypothetical protein